MWFFICNWCRLFTTQYLLFTSIFCSKSVWFNTIFFPPRKSITPQPSIPLLSLHENREITTPAIFTANIHICPLLFTHPPPPEGAVGSPELIPWPHRPQSRCFRSSSPFLCLPLLPFSFLLHLPLSFYFPPINNLDGSLHSRLLSVPSVLAELIGS